MLQKIDNPKKTICMQPCNLYIYINIRNNEHIDFHVTHSKKAKVSTKHMKLVCKEGKKL